MTDAKSILDNIDDASDSVSIKTILTIFANRSEWKRGATKALAASEYHRKAVKIRIAILNTLYHAKFEELRNRSAIARARQLDPNVMINLIEWNNYLADVPVLVQKAIRHANWLDLLESLETKMYPSWNRFWNLYEEDQRSPYPLEKALKDELVAFGTTFKTHRRKMAFLQSKILAGKAITQQLFKPEPDWFEWLLVTSSNSDESDTIDLLSGLVELHKSESDIDIHSPFFPEDDNDNDTDNGNDHRPETHFENQNLKTPAFKRYVAGYVEEIGTSEEGDGADQQGQDDCRIEEDFFEL
ncbi:hypothetical protein B0A52_07944 [Exophiala mesophila]|uniref:Uncharacterized protein n=1 Tax=Exophiala mesophila TaxID=212818 RepID=A0A438MXP6_EXOME|nr:hypothetical protein B0A52_07944 [Exophiala mesophila]